LLLQNSVPDNPDLIFLKNLDISWRDLLYHIDNPIVIILAMISSSFIHRFIVVLDFWDNSSDATKKIAIPDMPLSVRHQ
jgi:fumarate reductase subunit C